MGLVHRRLRPSVWGHPGHSPMCAATTGHLSRRAFEAIFKPAAVGVCPVEDHRAHPRPGRLPRREAKLSRQADTVGRTVLGRRRAPMMTSPTETVAGDNPGLAEVNTAHCVPEARRRSRDRGSRRQPGQATRHMPGAQPSTKPGLPQASQACPTDPALPTTRRAHQDTATASRHNQGVIWYDFVGD